MPISKDREDFRFYKIWADMKQRCNNPKCKKFNLYGGRGIQYYPEWCSYQGFKDDMWQSYKEHVALYGEKQTTLDRIDSNDHYYKDNCRWATYTEQRVNVRDKEEYCGYDLITSDFYKFNNCAQFAKEHNLKRQKIFDVINGKQLHHHNCIFAKIEDGNLDNARLKLLDMAEKVFKKYPAILEANLMFPQMKEALIKLGDNNGVH